MQKKIVVTGMGIISSIGNNIEETFLSLMDNKTGINYLNGDNNFFLAKINQTNEILNNCLKEKYSCEVSRITLLAATAIEEALFNAQMKNPPQNLKTGLISATTVGGMEQSEIFYKDFIENYDLTDFSKFKMHDCGEHVFRLARHFGISGYYACINTACSSAANAIIMGARLINNNYLDIAVVGGTDCLTQFTVNGFNSLKILDNKKCIPFDKERNGLNLGEGAAYLVLENYESAKKRNADVLCELKGYANVCDAYHQTATSPEGRGPYNSMKQAVERAGINLEEIDYINLHGTGTKNNDLSEGIAIDRLFGKNVPLASSTKTYTGHTLGASGSIEAVISILSLLNNKVFPTIGFSEKMPEISFSPVNNIINKIINNVLSNSFGFGGNNSSLIFSGV